LQPHVSICVTIGRVPFLFTQVSLSFINGISCTPLCTRLRTQFRATARPLFSSTESNLNGTEKSITTLRNYRPSPLQFVRIHKSACLKIAGSRKKRVKFAAAQASGRAREEFVLPKIRSWALFSTLISSLGASFVLLFSSFPQRLGDSWPSLVAGGGERCDLFSPVPFFSCAVSLLGFSVLDH
jgi:hypothetical protein